MRDRILTHLRSGAARTSARFPRFGRYVAAPATLVAERVHEDQLGIQAGSLTYGAFLSIPPVLMLVLSVAGLVFANNLAAQQKLLDEVTTLVPGLEQVVQTQLDLRPVGQASGGAVALVIVLWAASGWAARSRHALGVVFRTENTGLTTGRFVALLKGVPLLLLVMALVAFFVTASSLQVLGSFAIASDVAMGALALAAAFLLFLVTFLVMTPGEGPGWRGHVPGAVAMAVGFVILEYAGALYVTRVVAKSTALYGAIGAVFGVLAFLYLLMYLFLISAELSQVVIEKRSGVASG